MPEMKYTYVDGSNNQYRITSDKLEYKPITPEESSSGTYSGGEPKTVELSEAQFNAIVAAIENARNQPEAHIENRLMGSGTVVAYEDGKRVWKFMLSMRSKLKSEIEKVLKATLYEE